jgi:hypothetical protein
MKKLDFDILPLMISAILILVSLSVISTSNYILNLKHYIGFGCFIISIFFYFKNRMVYYLIFGLTLLVGVFGFLDFYFHAYKVGFGSFGVNPIFVILLIIHSTIVFKIAEKLDTNT